MHGGRTEEHDGACRAVGRGNRLLSLSTPAQIQFSHRPLDLLLAGDPHALRLTRSTPWAHL